MKVYVAGPMRGIPEFNYPAFTTATAKLRTQGHEVFNPTEQDLIRDNKDWGREVPSGNLREAEAKGFSLRTALGDDLAFICKYADAVALLPGWVHSKGARAERATAEALGLQVILLDRNGDIAFDRVLEA